MTNGLARLAAILLAVILASLCTLPASAETIPAQAEIRPLRIAVSSDLHMDPDNSDRTRGTQVVYNQELVDALLRDAKEQGAAFILITGDLVSSDGVTDIVERMGEPDANGSFFRWWQAHPTLADRIAAAKRRIGPLEGPNHDED